MLYLISVTVKEAKLESKLNAIVNSVAVKY